MGGRGAQTAAFGIDPDLAIAVDVTFAPSPGVDSDNLPAITALDSAVGPFIQPRLAQRLQKCADEHHVDLFTSVNRQYTGTDADEIGMSRGGVPSLVLSLPLRYMHTTMETISVDAIEEGSRLLAAFLSELDESWEVDLWT